MHIQKLRLQRGWSQEQLAVLSGLSVRTIQRLERGHSPSLESSNALAAVFEVDLHHLRETSMSASPLPSDRPLPPGVLTADEILAFARVRRLRGFYVHLFVFAAVLASLAALSFAFERRHVWLLYMATGWGIGIAAHGLRALDLVPFLGAEWERAKVEHYLGRKLG